MHPVKRRRLDKVNPALTKPFRSPLRTPRSNLDDPRHQSLSDAPVPRLQSTPKTRFSLTASPSQTTTTNPRLSPPTSSTQQPSNSHSNPEDQTPLSHDADELQRQYTSLTRHLTTLRQTLDTAQQAFKLETSDQSQDLDKLIYKWRSAARDVAEEVFAAMKQRVDTQGGVNKWLVEQEKEPPDIWYEERQIELTTAQRKMLEVQREEERKEAEKYGLIDRVGSRPQEATKSFTLDVMLEQMNIPLDLIGYDKERQQWTE